MAPPGFTSKKTTSKSSSTSGGPPGTSSGKSGQDILKDLKKEISRREFFKGREDVSDDRLLRRYQQDEELRKYKQDLVRQGKYMKTASGEPVRTASGDYVYTSTATFDTDSSSPTFGRYVTYGVSDKAQELARKYGPTFREIGSDIGYATGSMAKGFGDLLSSGSFGILGAIKGIANYALDKANKGYDKLNDVQKYVFDNADRFTFASKVPQVDEVSKAEELALQADRDALGLELDALIAQREEDRFRYENPTVDMRSPTVEGLAGIDIPADDYVESGQFKRDLQQSGIITIDDPRTQEAITDETKIPGENATIGDLKKVLKDRGFNDFQIEQTVNQVTQQIISGEYTGDVEVDTGSTTDDQASLSTDDGTQVTAYNNPVNLTDVGQAGTTGQTYGNNFAVFPDAETGIMAAKRDLALKTERYGGDVDKIIGEFSPRSDNPESFDNYVNFIKSGVGETVDPGEEDELLRRVIQFENKPDIANQYLTMVADGGMIDKQLKSLQNGLQNMYNGIPSVKRR